MSMQVLRNTPVLFLVFNRPEPTRRVFETIRKARPARLYIAADGARAGRPGEAARCEEVRSIVRDVDWPCEVKTLFRNRNLGCARAVSQAVSWLFEQEERAIILEDDCFPSQSFFRFCSELLEYYKDDSRVMQIAGNNFLSKEQRDQEYSYTFSNHNYVWGWATWRRAWQHYDYRMNLYGHVSQHGYIDSPYHTSMYEDEYIKWVYGKSRFGYQTVTWWSYQWDFARKVNSGVVVVPQKNLVVNIGIGMAEATHTKDEKGVGHDLKLEELDFPLRHPEFVMVDRVADDKIFQKYFTTPFSKMKSHVKRVLPGQIVRMLQRDYASA